MDFCEGSTNWGDLAKDVMMLDKKGKSDVDGCHGAMRAMVLWPDGPLREAKREECWKAVVKEAGTYLYKLYTECNLSVMMPKILKIYEDKRSSGPRYDSILLFLAHIPLFRIHHYQHPALILTPLSYLVSLLISSLLLAQ